MKRQTYHRCNQMRHHRHGLSSESLCGALLWPREVAEHMREFHGLEQGATDKVEDGRREDIPHNCFCGAPAVFFNSKERKCQECRDSERNSNPLPLVPGRCIQCRRIQPDEGDICGVCRERNNTRTSLMARSATSRRGM